MEWRGLLEMLISHSEERVCYSVTRFLRVCLSERCFRECVCARRVSPLVLETAPVTPFYS